jgi:hypothetical protein
MVLDWLISVFGDHLVPLTFLNFTAPAFWREPRKGVKAYRRICRRNIAAYENNVGDLSPLINSIFKRGAKWGSVQLLKKGSWRSVRILQSNLR